MGGGQHQLTGAPGARAVHRLEARAGPGLLGLGLVVGALGRLQVLVGRAAGLSNPARAFQRLGGQIEGVARLVVIVIGLGQVSRSDDRQHLPSLDALAQTDLQRGHPAGQRGEDVGDPRGIGLDRSGQVDHPRRAVGADRLDRQMRSKRRGRRHREQALIVGKHSRVGVGALLRSLARGQGQADSRQCQKAL